MSEIDKDQAAVRLTLAVFIDGRGLGLTEMPSREVILRWVDVVLGDSPEIPSASPEREA